MSDRTLEPQLHRELRVGSWRHADMVWQATLRYWSVLDRGGYRAVVLAELDADDASRPPLHTLWDDSHD